MGGLDRIFFENSDRLDPKSRSTTNWTKDFFRLQIFVKVFFQFFFMFFNDFFVF